MSFSSLLKCFSLYRPNLHFWVICSHNKFLSQRTFVNKGTKTVFFTHLMLQCLMLPHNFYLLKDKITQLTFIKSHWVSRADWALMDHSPFKAKLYKAKEHTESRSVHLITHFLQRTPLPQSMFSVSHIWCLMSSMFIKVDMYNENLSTCTFSDTKYF